MTAHPHLSLAPLTLRNLPKAVWISERSFRSEWPLVSMTLLWHLLRGYGLPCPFSMVRRRRLWLGFESKVVGSLDIFSTRIHEPDTRWVLLDGADDIPGDRLARFLLELMPECRLALLLTAGGSDWSERSGSVAYEGELPAPGGRFQRVYSVRRGAVTGKRSTGLWVSPRESREPEVHTEFYLISRTGRSIGLTGLYVTDWWSHIGWGGWGAILRKSAQLRTAEAALVATERLAKQRMLEWFCLETSGAPEYRSACWLYERCGLRPLLTVEDFYRDTGLSARERSYIVYGKEITYD